MNSRFPFGPGSPESTTPTACPSQPEGRGGDVAEDPPVHLGVADDAAVRHVGLPGLELRLHEHEGVPAGLEQPQHGRNGDPDADEGDVADEQVGRERQLGERAGVRPLEHGHARVVPELRVELPVADVDRGDARRPVLEEAVGEAARRGAEVDGGASLDPDVDELERVGELLASAGDEPGRPLDLELRVLVDLMPRLVVAPDEPRDHERLRLGPALGEPALHEQDVQALLHPRERRRRPCYTIAVELRGDRVVLRPLEEADVARIVEIGAEPSVRRWWSDVTAEETLAKVEGRDEATPFAIVVDGELAGLIEYHEETAPEFRSAGIDLFVAEAFQGRGLGVDAVRTLARHLIDDRGHHVLTIDPAADNEPAIRCYEKVGFRRVGILREYWTDLDGVRHDGLLLDLLARELR